MENNGLIKSTEVESTERGVPFFKIIYKNLLLIIMVTVLCALIGLGYSVLKVKPIYTVSRSYILRTTVSETGSSTNDASLGKIYIPMVESVITSPEVIAKANELYRNQTDPIKAGSVSITYTEKSLIFTMSYSDLSKEAATNKLNVLYEISKTELPGRITATEVSLIPTSKTPNEPTVNNGFAKYIVLGAAVGLVVSVIIALILYALDNTVRDKREYEEMTGSNVIAFIDKVEEKK
ncbi:MAG: hypothetical protein IKA11_00695 [Clostridia bacterium]|nr:hypothetical protein [Clostridia bacterium]